MIDEINQDWLTEEVQLFDAIVRNPFSIDEAVVKKVIILNAYGREVRFIDKKANLICYKDMEKITKLPLSKFQITRGYMKKVNYHEGWCQWLESNILKMKRISK
jgi:hypothetical protein